MNINYNPEPREFTKLQGNEYLKKGGNTGEQLSMPIDKYISEEKVQNTVKLLQKYPLSENDIRRERCHALASFLENVHDSCYQQCSTNNSFTFLSVKEGKCFRNCITKVTYHHPSLKMSVRDTAYIS